ncbi:MAG: hypothetical protein Q6K80_09770, partial [Thermostichus sp. DG_1_6_bins_120]
ALLALCLLGFEGLSLQPSARWWLVLIVGGGLYSLVAGVIWWRQQFSATLEDLGQRSLGQTGWYSAETPMLAHLINWPYPILTALIGLGLALWGESLMPLLVWPKPQLLVALFISWLLAQGRSLFRPSWMVEVGQLWKDYLQELRGAVLQPCYQRLETCRQSLLSYQAIWQDLQLEEMEAQHLLQLFSESLLPLTWTLQVYAQQVHHCCQQLADLLAQMQERVERLEQVLLDVELELEAHQPLEIQPQLINLLVEDSLDWQELDLQELVCLSQELLGTDRSLQGLTQELKSWVDQALPVGVKKNSVPLTPTWRWLGSLG